MLKFAILLPLVALCYYASPIEAQRFAPGYCPTVAAHENFDKTKFFGNWIEVEKTPSIFDLMMRCLVVDYSDDQDNTVNVVVRGISLAGLPLTVNGDGLLQDVHRSGFYSIRYGFGVPFQGTLTTILDTDYEDYAVVYSCTNSLLSGVFHSEYIWVLSRSGKISNPTRQNIYEKLDKLGINRSGLTMSDRSTCPTNSSTVGRESDKDLAAQVPLSGPSASSASGAPANGAADQAAAGAGPSSSAPVAALEKSSAAEAIQKSVVVPLLYDLPSAASSSSVGAPKQSSVVKASQAAPIDGKAAPIQAQAGGAPNKPQQVAAASPAKPIAASSAAAGAGQGASGQQAAVSQQQSAQQAAPAQQVQASSASSSVSQKSSNQQPQQQSLMAKIQQKP
uniref:Apolipoprotein D n=1 Tax=Aceria tosichella TaxID=561515 RepID=A0A6G1SAR8_9ACAR